MAEADLAPIRLGLSVCGLSLSLPVTSVLPLLAHVRILMADLFLKRKLRSENPGTPDCHGWGALYDPRGPHSFCIPRT
jgi:hypothetical protein